ncbi:MAG TPA: exosortase-associated EpsI family protein [Gemmataceae bacterium]|nr:exosortase-associated EpsI family protein [Gemmataceae bacterium]
MSRFFSILVVFVAIGLSGFGHGLVTGRWNISEDPEQTAARLKSVPITVGDWDGQEDSLDARDVEAADITGHLVRPYVNRRTGDRVTLLLVCGRPGPVSVHTPDVCYRATGYELMEQPAHYTSPTLPDAEFWATRFQKVRAAVPEHLRIFYSWSAKGAWSAPENPRLTFFRQSVLYKLYVIRQMASGEEPLEDDPALAFLHVLMPELQKTLFSEP